MGARCKKRKSVQSFWGFCLISFLVVGFLQADLADLDEKAVNQDKDKAEKEELLEGVDKRKNTQMTKKAKKTDPIILSITSHEKDEGKSDTIFKSIKKRLIQLKYDTSFDFEVLEDKRAILKDFSSVLEKASFYSVLIYSTLPYRRLTVALDKSLKIFIMPQEINMIISDDFKRNINKEKVLSLAELYVVLSAVPPHLYQLISSSAEISNSEKKGDSPLKYEEVIHAPIVEEYENYYTVKLLVWGNIGGSLELWNLSITNKGKVNKEKKILGKGIGDFEVIQ